MEVEKNVKSHPIRYSVSYSRRPIKKRQKKGKEKVVVEIKILIGIM